jgi:hypothetical protein
MLLADGSLLMWDNGGNAPGRRQFDRTNFSRAIRYVLDYTTLTMTKVITIVSSLIVYLFHLLGLAVQCYEVFRHLFFVLWECHHERGEQCYMPRFTQSKFYQIQYF